MTTINVAELKERACALEKEALLALTPSIVSEAFPRWIVKCELFPYWRNRVPTFAAEEADDDYGDEGAVYNYTVNSLLVIAHTTSDIAGESEDLMDFVVPQVVEYVDARAHLQSETFPEAMPWLERASFVTGGYTPAGFSVGGVACQGVAFQWNCKFRKRIHQFYLG